MPLSRISLCLALLVMSPATLTRAFGAEGEANAIFLVAKREMRDARFRETVILVTQPRRGGPWGVIVNKPLEERLTEVFPEHESLKKRKDVLYFGGPVSPRELVFLVRSSKAPRRALHVLKDVYFTGDPAWIAELLKRPDPTAGLRVYAGHSGWSPGQLQNELARGDWHVVPAAAEFVFETDSARIWPELIRRATIKHTRLSFAPAPETVTSDR